MADTVFHTNAVILFFQLPDSLLKLLPILLQNSRSYHIKAFLLHLILGTVSQKPESRPVHTDNMGTVQRMAHHAAVHGCKDRLQRVVFLYDFLLIGPLLGHVDGNAHGPHHAAVQIIKGRLVGSQKLCPFPAFHHFLGDTGFSAVHNHPLRLDAGGIVFLHVPDIGVAAPFHLVLGLIHRLAETVIHFLMNPVLIFKPYEIRHIVDSSLQVLAGLPEIFIRFALLLPFQKTETNLLL